jgi:hypothetical protein
MQSNEQQRYNQLINRLSYSFLRIILTFIVVPFFLIALTPLGYLTSLVLTIITITLINQIKKRYVGKR